MQATLNVRMDATLKQRGEAVLREYGISTSEAIRCLWNELAESRQVPAFMQGASEAAQQKAKKKAALMAFAGIGTGPYSDLTDEELARIYEKRYE